MPGTNDVDAGGCGPARATEGAYREGCVELGCHVSLYHVAETGMNTCERKENQTFKIHFGLNSLGDAAMHGTLRKEKG